MDNQKLTPRDRLKDLFTTTVIVRKKENKLVSSKISNKDSEQFLDGFKKILRTQYSKMHNYWGSSFEQSNKKVFYVDYDQMDQDSIISSALDIFADECVLKFEDGEILKITTEDHNIKSILENLFYDVLNIQFNLWAWIRNLVKYGDFYLQPIMRDGYGIIDFELVSVYDIERIEENKETKFNMLGGSFGEFEIIHFRLLSDSNFFPYGRSMVEGGRKIWRQLTLLEDAMLIHRIMRAPEKRVFKIDVGNLPPEAVDTYMEKLIGEMKKEPYVDENGNINLEFNLHNMMEDIYLPVRGGKSGTEVDTLSALGYEGIEDIEYLKNKLLASIKIPQQFLNFTEANEGKATLSAMDLRFARTIERIQNVVLSELYNIAYIHLTLQGFDKSSLMNFELELNNPSIVYQQEKLEFLNQKIGVARDLKDLKLLSHDYIYQNVFKLSDKEAEYERKKIKLDVKYEALLEKITSGEIEINNDGEIIQKNSELSNIEGTTEEPENNAADTEEEIDDLADELIAKEEGENKIEKPDKNPLKYDFRNGPLGLK